MSEINLKCFITSQATEYEIHSTTKAVQITFHTRDSIACVYDGQWWLAEMNDISDINKNMLVTIYHPCQNKDSFQEKGERPNLGAHEQCFKETKCLRSTTTTGRTHSISPKLTEEISKLLNEYKSR
ncbi:hypothetical protein AVEN_60269-1 [Araneus ventricosus]|uniref:Uncharacterized protein n=1 Tax=Araneus ventricosus TaxID=182803 RepID=A0A4Y2D255_ARAVE|nr:hypothetical protein AVEN_60269-1 [Araneus ventricosus]